KSPCPGGFELGEPGVAMEILRDIVDPHEVDAIDPHAFEAIFDGSLRAVRRIVVDDLVGPAMLEERALLAEMAGPHPHLVEDDTSDFPAEDVVVAPVF